MSATGVFSYAQAARGVGTSSTTSSIPPSSASSDHGAREHATTTDTAGGQLKNIRNLTRTNTDQSSIPEATAKAPQHDAATDKSVEHARPVDGEGSATTATTKQRKSSSAEHPVSSPQSTASSGPKVDGEPRQLSKGRKASIEDKTKDVDDDWEKISLPSTAAEKELKAAPVPTVNIWQKRKQEQEAKLKQEVQRSSSTGVQTKPVSTEASGPKVSNITESSEVSMNKRSASNKGSGHVPASPRPVPQKDSPRPAQPSLPPVDAASWPTPESATTTDTGRRTSNVEKVERSEGSEAKSASRKNQWQAMPFVPSVKFETQLPGSRRGGRPLDGRARGARAPQADRTTDKAESGSMGPPPVPKNASEQDRGRKNNAQKAARASSVPSDTTKPNESIQSGLPISAATAESFEPNLSDLPVPMPHQRSQGTGTPAASRPSRSSSTNPAHMNEISDPFAIPSFVPSASAPDPTGSPTRRSPTGSRYPGPRTSQDFTHDRSTTSREYKKDHAGGARDKDNWREARGQGSRGRASYRGRGGHAGYVPPPSYTTPLPQNGFDFSRTGSLNEGRASRHTQAFNAMSPLTGNRSYRSPQLPMETMMNNIHFSPPPMTGYPPILSPVGPNVGYPSFSPMVNGLPAAMSPNSAINTPELQMYAVNSMVATQVEYYFSLDNLCKDMYLRKHMDSQGFVPLRVISEFRRVKSLLGETSTSYDQLCTLCQQARNVEVATGDDGELRLRSRDNWKDFVLPMDERLPVGRSDGPRTLSHNRRSMGMPYDFDVTNGTLRGAPPHMNGFHDSFGPTPPQPFTNVANHVPQGLWLDLGQDARKASINSSHQKVQSPEQELNKPPFGKMANGHRDSTSSSGDKESTFPDESVAALKVVVRDPEYQGDDDSVAVEQSRVSGLRGSAGSPEQLERHRNLVFGNNASPAARGDNRTMYFTPNDSPPPQFQKPGFIHEEYPILYERAQAQRVDDYLDDAVKALYNFWAEFLCVPNQFNVGLYEDFKTWALEDQKNGNDNGKLHLFCFYDVMLGSKTAVSERIAKDIVSIARAEDKSDRQLWKKLRAAWRNGATNMKTVKRLNDLLTAEEKTELDKSA